MKRSNGTQPSRPKGPGVAYLALATATMVLVATVALNASQPPPPTVAGFAPQANERIDEAPENQTGEGGDGGRGATGGTATPTPTTTPTPTGTPTPSKPGLICYGNPPRQTEDPQSPPCVNKWDPKLDNGGATYQGVTGDEIRIAWPVTIEKPGDTERLVRYFNMRYEFYGRKIVLQQYGPKGGVFGTANPADMQQDADFVNESIKAFASLAYVPRSGAERHYYDRLAQHGIVSVDSHASQRTEAHYTRFQPYQWGYMPAYDTMMRNFGEMICKSLAGHRPEHGGTGIEDRTTPRRFGLAVHVAPEGSSPDRSYLTNALRACGAAPVVSVQYTTPEQTVLRLKEKDVTTVICLCQADQYFNLMPEATRQIWFPEWLVSSYHYLDYDSAAQNYPREHQDHVLGVTFHNKWLPQKEMPWYQAIKQADPDYETGDDGWASAAYERYYELLVLASGIQMAGPNLTPKTFQEGLFKASFPRPGSGTAPLWYAGGGFGPGDHTMVDDGTMIWYSQTDMGYTTNVRRGTFCYVKRGKRYGLGQWPSGRQPFFEQPCK